MDTDEELDPSRSIVTSSKPLNNQEKGLGGQARTSAVKQLKSEPHNLVENPPVPVGNFQTKPSEGFSHHIPNSSGQSHFNKLGNPEQNHGGNGLNPGSAQTKMMTPSIPENPSSGFQHSNPKVQIMHPNQSTFKPNENIPNPQVNQYPSINKSPNIPPSNSNLSSNFDQRVPSGGINSYRTPSSNPPHLFPIPSSSYQTTSGISGMHDKNLINPPITDPTSTPSNKPGVFGTGSGQIPVLDKNPALSSSITSNFFPKSQDNSKNPPNFFNTSSNPEINEKNKSEGLIKNQEAAVFPGKRVDDQNSFPVNKNPESMIKSSFTGDQHPPHSQDQNLLKKDSMHQGGFREPQQGHLVNQGRPPAQISGPTGSQGIPSAQFAGFPGNQGQHLPPYQEGPQPGNQRFHQSGPQGAPQLGNQGLPQGVIQSGPQGAPQLGNQGLPKLGPQGTPQLGNQGFSQSGPQLGNQGLPQGVTQLGPQGVPQLRNQGIPQPGSQGAPQYRNQGLPQGLPQFGHEIHKPLNQSGPGEISGVTQAYQKMEVKSAESVQTKPSEVIQSSMTPVMKNPSNSVISQQKLNQPLPIPVSKMVSNQRLSQDERKPQLLGLHIPKDQIPTHLKKFTQDEILSNLQKIIENLKKIMSFNDIMQKINEFSEKLQNLEKKGSDQAKDVLSYFNSTCKCNNCKKNCGNQLFELRCADIVCMNCLDEAACRTEGIHELRCPVCKKVTDRAEEELVWHKLDRKKTNLEIQNLKLTYQTNRELKCKTCENHKKWFNDECLHHCKECFAEKVRLNLNPCLKCSEDNDFNRPLNEIFDCANCGNTNYFIGSYGKLIDNENHFFCVTCTYELYNSRKNEKFGFTLSKQEKIEVNDHLFAVCAECKKEVFKGYMKVLECGNRRCDSCCDDNPNHNPCRVCNSN